MTGGSIGLALRESGFRGQITGLDQKNILDEALALGACVPGGRGRLPVQPGVLGVIICGVLVVSLRRGVMPSGLSK